VVKSVIDLSERESRIINIVKAKYGLKDKSQALSVILKHYEECELELQLRPEFIEEVENARKTGKYVKVKDFAKEFDLK
jgi:hypothetical protein